VYFKWEKNFCSPIWCSGPISSLISFPWKMDCNKRKFKDSDQVYDLFKTLLWVFKVIMTITKPQINKLINFFKQIIQEEKPQRFLVSFRACLNESSKNNENSQIEWLQNETIRYIPKTKVYVVSLISVVFKTSIVIFLRLSCLKFVI
jgi:hypothetical protein